MGNFYLITNSFENTEQGTICKEKHQKVFDMDCKFETQSSFDASKAIEISISLAKYLLQFNKEDRMILYKKDLLNKINKLKPNDFCFASINGTCQKVKIISIKIINDVPQFQIEANNKSVHDVQASAIIDNNTDISSQMQFPDGFYILYCINDLFPCGTIISISNGRAVLEPEKQIINITNNLKYALKSLQIFELKCLLNKTINKRMKHYNNLKIIKNLNIGDECQLKKDVFNYIYMIKKKEYLNNDLLFYLKTGENIRPYDISQIRLVKQDKQILPVKPVEISNIRRHRLSNSKSSIDFIISKHKKIQKMGSNIFLNNEIDLKKVVLDIKSDINIVQLKNNNFSDYFGLVINSFKFNKEQYVAVKISQTKKLQFKSNIYDFNLFGKQFQGFIVKKSEVKEIEKTVHHIDNSRIINEDKIFYIEEMDDETNCQKFLLIKDSNPINYGKLLKNVEINCVKCVLVEPIITNHPIEKNFYLKFDDVEIINDLKPIIKYHDQVIVKPDSILDLQYVSSNKFKNNIIVGFEDSSNHNYQGKVVWTGKANEDMVALIVLSEGSVNDNIIPYKIDKTFRNKTLFEEEAVAIFVGQFVLVLDPTSYITCSITKLDVIDPKFKYLFVPEKCNEKLLLFTIQNVLHAMILKWKGLINDQMCIGCQLNGESEQGSGGSYGTEVLFHCPPKSGIIITADKLNSKHIKDLCELNNGHKTIETLITKFGFRVYNRHKICCVESSSQIDDHIKFKIGCKIMHENLFIGICKFVGYVNGKPTIGIEKLPQFNGNSLTIMECIEDFAFKKTKFDFIDINNIEIGSYYTTQDSHFSDLECEINSLVHYFPDNNRNVAPLHGKVKWLGLYDNKCKVIGIDLEKEYVGVKNSYFLEEGLFEYKTNHGIIDDIYKIEFVENCHYLEQEKCISTIEPNYNKDNLIRSLLQKDQTNNILKNADILITSFKEEFIEYLNNLETIPGENLSSIIDLLFEKKEFETINQLISNLKTKPLFETSYLSFLIKCLKENKFGIIHNIINTMEISNNNDEHNIVCLKLALECLKQFNKSDYNNLYQLLLGKCNNKNCLLILPNNEEVEETFLTIIISNQDICEDIVINILNSKFFDINMCNSNNQSPMELAIVNLKYNVLQTLFKLGCDKSALNSCFLKLYKLERKESDVVEQIIKLILEEMKNK